MLRILSYVAGGLISASAAFAGGYLGPSASPSQAPASFDARWDAAAPQSVKQNKRDRVAAPRPVESRPSTTVELVGLSNIAVVYRDQNGQVLFRNDPVTETTVVMKGFVVPDVTIRKNPPASPRLAPRDAFQDKLPIACESAFSPVASPALANIAGRCMASGFEQFASRAG